VKRFEWAAYVVVFADDTVPEEQAKREAICMSENAPSEHGYIALEEEGNPEVGHHTDDDGWYERRLT
jgi:hypothetical protein